VVVPAPHDRLTEQAGVRWYHLRGPAIPWQRPYRALLAARALPRIVAHERPDVIELGSPMLAPWLLQRPARLLGRPLVSFHHRHVPRMIAPHGAADFGRRTAVALAWRYLRRVNRLAAQTLAASSFVADELAEAGFRNVGYVPLGVDLDLFHPGRRAQRASTRAAFGLPAAPLALYVGRLTNEKELDLLLRAWPRVEARIDAHLCIAGDGPSRDRLRRECRARNVHWLPYQAERAGVANLMAAADLYVSPCSFETFGLAALEALASGTPVLCADRGGVAELARASQAGALFASGSSEDLAETASALLRLRLESLGARGRAYAEGYHSWTAVFDRLFAIYRELAARPC
jgi:alpha-1,6-mannosyltransferase